MSWESTVSYYQIINQAVKQHLGGLHSAKVVLYSVDFVEIEELQHKGDWAATATILTEAAQAVEKAGADFLLICTNTMHKVAPVMEPEIKIPILHIADATAEVIKMNGLKKIGLLGTAFTMEQDFYKGRLMDKFGFEVLIPDQEERKLIHKVIYEELCAGIVNEESKEAYLKIIDNLKSQGAEAVILGCTEIGLLVADGDVEIPLLDTTRIHAEKSVAVALGLIDFPA